MKSKNKIIILIITFLFIISTTIFTYALLESKVYKDEIEFNVGNLELSFTGSIDNILIPGKNIIEKPFVVNNKSNIEIDLIIEVEIILNNENILKNNIEGVIVKDNLEIIDNKYFLKINKTTKENIDIITNIELDGNYIKSNYSHKDFKIIFNIYAKQHNYVEWEEIEIIR